MSRIALITLPSRLIIHAHQCSVGMRAHPDLNQGPADLQSAALTAELSTRVTTLPGRSHSERRMLGRNRPPARAIKTYARAGSQTRVTSVGCLYDAATLRAPTQASRLLTTISRHKQSRLGSSVQFWPQPVDREGRGVMLEQEALWPNG